MRNPFHYNLALAVFLVAGFSSVRTVNATDSISTPFGNSSFEYIFYNLGEIYDAQAYAAGKPGDPGYSTKQLSDYEKNHIAKAGMYWSYVLGPGSKSTAPVRINVGTFNEENANATSEPNENEDLDNIYNGMQRQIISNTLMDYPARITVGRDYFSNYNEHWVQLPVIPYYDTTSTIVHEIGHALGILSFVGLEDTTTHQMYKSSFDNHLQDYFGTLYSSKTSISEIKCAYDGSTDKALEYHNAGNFVAGKYNRGTYGIWFKGDNVTDVMTVDGNTATYSTSDTYNPNNPMAIKNGMIRVQAYEEDIDGNVIGDFSHLELRNSLMSHQSYRNWTSFMEAELAVLEDIGYDIDRRNHFGFSIYNNGLTYTNNHPFYKRNSSRTGYLYGTPNTTPLGIGLHLYGSGNTIYQNAHLLADGEAGTGIRVDGSSNSLTVNAGIRVTANGDYGNALLVSYGRNNSIFHYGSLEATGKDGIAARFDFGHNLLADKDDYRGSYIWSGNEADYQSLPSLTDGVPDEIYGPLVDTFVVGGSLNGSKASIYISESAYVRDINVLTGAKIKGDIISRWNPNNSLIASSVRGTLFTTLDFGLKLEGSSAVADSNFNMKLEGGIYGLESFKMHHYAGTLDVSGPISVYSLENDGYLAIHKDATVKTSFENSGSLEFGFYGNGSHNKVSAASYDVAGSSLVYRLEGGYFTSGSYNLPEHHNPYGSTDISGLTFGASNLDISPTLNFVFDGDRSLVVERPYNAYSRYALSRNSRGVGSAFPYAAEHAYGRMRDLVASIDFSAKDGSGIDTALTLLSPQAIDASSAVSLSSQESATYYLNRHIMNQVSAAQNLSMRGVNFTDFLGFNFNETREEGSKAINQYHWRGFIIPYASFNKMQSGTDNPGYKDRGFSVLAGADRRVNSELSIGFHSVLSSHRTYVSNGHDADMESVGMYLGSHALFTPESMPGYYFSGLMRFGIEDNDIKRSYFANGFAGKVKGSYKSKVMALGLQGGKDFYFLKNRNLSAGPVGYLNYSRVHRPSFTESGDVFALKYKEHTSHALSSSLGGHIDYLTSLSDDTTFGISFVTLWNHEYLSLDTHSRASFRDYDAVNFESTTRLPKRDSLLFELGFRLNFPSDIFVEACGSYSLRAKGDSMGGLIRAGWEM